MSEMRSGLAVGLAMSAAIAGAGCSSNSSSGPGNSSADAAAADTGGGGGVADSGSLASDSGPAGDSATCTTGTLYSRLGGHAGIRSAINAVVGAELADTDIKSYFFNQLKSPVPSTSPTGGEIEECLTIQLGAAAGGPGEVYPPDGGAYDDGGGNLGGPAGTWVCRDMATIHQPLLISGGTFDRFITIAGGELTKLGVCPDDIGTVAGVLVGTKGQVVSASLNDAGDQAYPGDAGSATGDASGD